METKIVKNLKFGENATEQYQIDAAKLGGHTYEELAAGLIINPAGADFGLVKSGGDATIDNGIITLNGANVGADNSVAHTKTVPANTLPYAEITEIGGMTYKDGDTLRSAPVSAVESAGGNLLNIGTLSFTQSRSVVLDSPIPAGTYTLSALATSTGTDVEYCRAYFYDNNNNEIAQGQIQRNARKSFTVELPIPCYTMTFFAETYSAVSAGDTATWADIMFNKGSTALPYTPYTKRTLEIPEAVRSKPWYGLGISKEVCNAIRYNEDGSRSGNVRCYYGVIDGSTGFMASTYQNTFAVAVSNLFAFSRVLTGIADKYDRIGGGDIGVKDGVYITNTDHIYISDSRFKDLATAKEILAANPIDIVCADMTITTEDISDILPADNYIGVESGGTVTMVNEYDFDVPSTIEFYTSDNIQEAIGAKKLVGELIGNASSADTAKAADRAIEADTATALTSTSIGSNTQPVYFDANGKPVATTYTLEASVPSGAKFTDTNNQVAQGRTGTTFYRPLLMHNVYTNDYGSDPGSTTAGVFYNESIAASAGTGALKAVKFVGDLEGNADTATKVQNTLKVGSKTYDGSSSVEIQVSDLGLEQAMKFLGSTTTAISDGSTTKTITVNSKSVTVTNGNVVLYNGYEYVWTGSAWEQLGQEGSFSLKTHRHTVPITPAGTVSTPTITVTPNTTTVNSITGVGSLPSLTYSDVTAKSVKSWSAGSAPSLTYSAVEADNITAWSAGSGTASLTGSVGSGPNRTVTLTFSHTHTAPSLTYSAVSADNITAWSAGSVPSLTTEDKTASKITSWSAGSLPTSEGKTVVTGIKSAISTQPTFTGTAATLTTSAANA